MIANSHDHTVDVTFGTVAKRSRRRWRGHDRIRPTRPPVFAGIEQAPEPPLAGVRSRSRARRVAPCPQGVASRTARGWLLWRPTGRGPARRRHFCDRPSRQRRGRRCWCLLRRTSESPVRLQVAVDPGGEQARRRLPQSRQSKSADRSLPTPGWPARRPVAQVARCEADVVYRAETCVRVSARVRGAGAVVVIPFVEMHPA